MSIKKILLLASMALAVIAFAAPAAAQAEIELTAGGESLEAGDPVTAISKDLVTTVGTGGNRLTCEEVVLHYTVGTNGVNHVVLNPTVAHNATVKNCQTHVVGVGTFPNHITNAGAGQLTLNTWGTGSAAATFTSNTTALGLHCSYTGNIPVQATETTTASQLHVETGNSLTAPESGCAAAEMHGSFTVVSGLNPVEAHFVTTP